MMTILFSAILITGGGGYMGAYKKSAEIYVPSNNTHCSLPELPELPEGRGWHTQDGPWACGGGDYRDSTHKTCDLWSQGSWTRQVLSLRNVRWGHVSWATASGLYLMGGDNSGWDSELVKEDGSVKDGFPLQYNTE